MSTLKTPLFVNGMFNRSSKHCRADFLRTVSNGEQSFNLWTTDEKRQYPQGEKDVYLLFVEVNDYLVPLRMTEHFLIDRLGYEPMVAELYGTAEKRAQIWREAHDCSAMAAAENPVIERYGSDPARQAAAVQEFLSDEVRLYTDARDNGGRYVSFIGAAVLGELDICVKLSAKRRAEEEARIKAARREREAEEEREKAAQEELQRKAREEAENIFKRGGLIDSGRILVELADAHGVKIPLRTRGWILDTFAQCRITVDGGEVKYSVMYYKTKNGSGSTRIYSIIENLREAIIAA